MTPLQLFGLGTSFYGVTHSMPGLVVAGLILLVVCQPRSKLSK